MSFLQKLFGRSKPNDSSPKPQAGRPAARPPSADELAAEGDYQAITQRFHEVYGEQVPFHYGAVIPFEDGGPDPLGSVSIFWSQHGPHWHYVSFGLAEVMGAEFTFRLRAKPADRGGDAASFQDALARNAPTWPILMLNMLARRVHRTRRPFGIGHWWQGPPGVLRPHSELCNLAFARDPELGIVTTSLGELLFLQTVGVDPETVQSMMNDEREGRGDDTLDALMAKDPLLVTDG